jgi:hypothetical protein
MAGFEYDQETKLKLTREQWRSYYLWDTSKEPLALNEIMTYGCSENEWADRQARYHGEDQSVTMNFFSNDGGMISGDRDGTYKVQGSRAPKDGE